MHSSNCSATCRPPIRRKILTALRAEVTPEMVSYFSEQLTQNAQPRADQSRHAT